MICAQLEPQLQSRLNHSFVPSFTMPLIARRFSITNFLIATSALGFQVFVLYPWHNRLDEDFTALRQENLRLMQRIEGRLGIAKIEGKAEAPTK